MVSILEGMRILNIRACRASKDWPVFPCKGCRKAVVQSCPKIQNPSSSFIRCWKPLILQITTPQCIHSIPNHLLYPMFQMAPPNTAFVRRRSVWRKPLKSSIVVSWVALPQLLDLTTLRATILRSLVLLTLLVISVKASYFLMAFVLVLASYYALSSLLVVVLSPLFLISRYVFEFLEFVGVLVLKSSVIVVCNCWFTSEVAVKWLRNAVFCLQYLLYWLRLRLVLVRRVLLELWLVPKD